MTHSSVFGLSPLAHRLGLAEGEQQVAIAIALERIEPGIAGLAFRLHPLRLLEQRLRRRHLPRLMPGVGKRGAVAHALEGVAAPVGMLDRRLARGHRRRDLAQGELQLREVGGADRGLLPVLLLDAISSPARIGATASPSRPSARRRIGGLVQEPGAVGLGEIGGGMVEGRIEEGRHQPQIRAERAEFLDEIGLALADDAVMINLVQRLLPPPRLAAMVDRLEQRRHLGEAVGPVLVRQVLQMLIQPLMSGLPGFWPLGAQPRTEVLAHEGMRVQLVRCVVAFRRQKAKLAEFGEMLLPHRLADR